MSVTRHATSRSPAPRPAASGGPPSRAAIFVPAVLLAAALGLVALYWLSLRPGFPFDPAPFDVNGEMNIPALFSAALWVGAAGLALVCMRRSRAENWPLGGYWPLMAVLFLYLGVDEAMMIHEGITVLSDGRDAFSGAFYYSWVIAGLAFLGIMGLVFLRFLAALRPVNLALLILAAGVFVAGAAGVEMMGAAYDAGGRVPGSFALGLNWRRANALEEGLEMLGVILLIHVMLRFATDPAPPFRDGAGRREISPR